jgi:hypothetical protein
MPQGILALFDRWGGEGYGLLVQGRKEQWADGWAVGHMDSWVGQALPRASLVCDLEPSGKKYFE